MLVLTENATSVIRALGERPELPGEAGGVRITGPEDGSSGLSIEPSPQPAIDDQIVETQGARVFLDRTAADVLDDKVLDAQVDHGGNVQFLLRVQA